jgi:hypothetical protein
MVDEYTVLIDNGTWHLGLQPPGAKVVSGKWIYKSKFNLDGSLACHKVRWVVRGFSQHHSIDYDKTFSPVVKSATIRVVLSIAISQVSGRFVSCLSCLADPSAGYQEHVSSWPP